MMMRCFLNTDLNAGFSAIVSERALIIFEPILMSFAHTGTSPQWNTCNVGLAVGAGHDAVDVVGRRGVVVLGQRASRGSNDAPKYSAIFSGELEDTNRPHIDSHRSVRGARLAMVPHSSRPAAL